MKEPQTYEEFGTWLGECQHAGTKDASEWAEANPEAYTELRLAHMKTLPRDMYRKWERDENWEAIATPLMGLFFDDEVDQRGYKGSEHSARYWEAYFSYFRIKRATIYAADRKLKEQKFKEVLDDPESTKEDIQKAWRSLERAVEKVGYAKNYKDIKKRHEDEGLAKAIFDYLLERELARLPDNAGGLNMHEARHRLITEVMHILWQNNDDTKPKRPTVDRWLKKHRIYEYEYWKPEVVEQLKEQFPDTPIEYLTTNPKKAK